VDFRGYLADWRKTVLGTWEKSLPVEAKATLPRGEVTIRFRILPNGELMKGSMVLEGRSRSAELDRAVWSTLTDSRYPSLPSQFHGPYLELRTTFSYD
jgi:hypothetical protein